MILAVISAAIRIGYIRVRLFFPTREKQTDTVRASPSDKRGSEYSILYLTSGTAGKESSLIS